MNSLLCICSTNDLMVTYIAALAGLVIAVVMGFNILQYININNRIRAVKKSSDDLMKRSDQIENDYKNKIEALNNRSDQIEKDYNDKNIDLKNYILAWTSFNLYKTFQRSGDHDDMDFCLDAAIFNFKKIKIEEWKDTELIESLTKELEELRKGKK